jgi:hypothetical protein
LLEDTAAAAVGLSSVAGSATSSWGEVGPGFAAEEDGDEEDGAEEDGDEEDGDEEDAKPGKSSYIHPIKRSSTEQSITNHTNTGKKRKERRGKKVENVVIGAIETHQGG